MKACFYCGKENSEDALKCVECGKPIEPPPPPDDRTQLEDPTLSLVVVETFRNVVDAGMFKARLEAEGIEACVPEEFTPQIFWNVIPSPLETVTVRVAAKDYEAARELLASYSNQAIAANLPLGTLPPDEPAPPVIPDDLPGKPCVACGTRISEAATLCPKCGWTQPG